MISTKSTVTRQTTTNERSPLWSDYIKILLHSPWTTLRCFPDQSGYSWSASPCRTCSGPPASSFDLAWISRPSPSLLNDFGQNSNQNVSNPLQEEGFSGLNETGRWLFLDIGNICRVFIECWNAKIWIIESAQTIRMILEIIKKFKI